MVNSLNPGGTERLVVEMSLAFSSDYRLQVICLDFPGAWASDLRERGIPVHCLWRQPGLDTAMPARLARLFREHDTAIIHAHQCTPWFYSALSRLYFGKPRLLLEEHGRFYPEVLNRKRTVINKTLIRPLTHRFIAVSKDVGSRLVRYEGLQPQDIEVIYNGVSPPPVLSTDQRVALRGELGFAADDFVVGTVGRFDPIKNLPMLMESLRAASAAEPAIKGLLVGDGPAMPEIRKMAQQGSTKGRVVLTGYRRDARQLAQCMDLFVLPSFSEGTSMALLEAMTAGVAVAVTEVGGNPEIVVDRETGWTVPSGATDRLTAVLLEAVGNIQLRKRFADAGRRRVAELFSVEQMLAAYRRLYSSLVPEAAVVGQAA